MGPGIHFPSTDSVIRSDRRSGKPLRMAAYLVLVSSLALAGPYPLLTQLTTPLLFIGDTMEIAETRAKPCA